MKQQAAKQQQQQQQHGAKQSTAPSAKSPSEQQLQHQTTSPATASNSPPLARSPHQTRRAHRRHQANRHQTPRSPTRPRRNLHNLSYHQQQQLHHRNIQRFSGAQRLAAELASVHFLEDVDGAPATTRSRRPQQHDKVARRHHHHQHRARLESPSEGAASPVSPTRQQQRLIQQQLEAHLQQQQQQQIAIQQQIQQQQQQTDQQQQQPSIFAEGRRSTTVGSQDSSHSTSSTKNSENEQARDLEETKQDATALLKRYQLVALIGIGNYARVYRVTALATGHEFAIKAINLRKTSDNYRNKFLPRELEVLKRINHPNICKTYEILGVNNRVFIVMQFCPRGTIADLLQKLGPFSEPLARFMFAPIVDAVVYLHSIDCSHRDLKVENILLDAEYAPKLTDFSYSSFLSDMFNQNADATVPVKSLGSPARLPRNSLRLNDTFCGTLPYLSPEMIRQYPYDSKKTDVWSLGICLYVMLNDRLPFPYDDVRLMVKKQLTREYKFKLNIDYSNQVRDLVGQMLEPEFSRRPSSLDVHRHQWMSGPRERPSPG